MILGSSQQKNSITVEIHFENTVDKMHFKYQMDLRAMLSFIGGIIGTCKEIFWLIVLFLTALSFCLKDVKLF